MITQSYKLNIVPYAEQTVRGMTSPKVPVSQYDKGLRTLVFDLYDGANGRLTLLDGQTAKIYGKKPDANVFEYDMTVSEDKQSVSIVLQEQMAVIAGCVECEVRIFQGANTVGSANFKMIVEPAPVGADEVYSESEIPEIDNLLYGGTAGQVFTKTPTGARWADIGTDSGLMMKSEYDPNDTGSVLKADHADDASTVEGHTVARDVLANEYTNEQIDSMMQAAGTVKTVNSVQPDQNGNVQISKNDIGLDNVDNTSDADKPISTAAQGALDQKVDKVPGMGLSQNSFTDAEEEKLGALPTSAELATELSEKVDKEAGKGLSTNDFTTAEKNKLQGIQEGAQVNTVTGVKGDSETTYRTGNIEITKNNIGLGNVDNTADSDKPVSTAMRTALDGKVDKETGKGLSSNDFTTEEKNKLAGIEAGAEVNVQANWNETDQTADSFIKNKPSIPSKTSDLTNDSGFVTDAAMQSALDQKVDKVQGKQLSTEDFTSAEKTKLAGIEAGAQVNTITGVKGDAEAAYRTGDVNITKANIGLGNVDNTSDLDKPISTATQAALTQKQDVLTFDNVPTASSDNPVKSSGIKSALDTKQNSLTFDSTPTENSTNPVTSGGIYLSQKAQDDKIDTISDLLDAKFADDWATIQTMIQIGYGKKYYPVGTQFTIHHDVYGDMLFDVIGHDHDLPAGKDHSMTLLMHNVIYSTQFDEIEGFYYCENGLTAGTYNVTITRQPWFAGDVGKTFQFTLASDVPAGAILWWDGYNATREGRTVRVYNTRGATSASQTATMTEGNGGTSLGNIDGTGNCNYFDRTVLGSNDWEESGVRQWLNADTASDWWEPKTKWDRLVNYYSRPGFLYGLDADFKKVLVETTHGNRSNTVYDSHGTNVAYSTTEKIFLLCNEEVNLAQEQGIVCGTVYEFYKNAANADRIKYDITSTGTARFWWLRSPYPSYASYERRVHTSGALYYNYAIYGYGVAAACVIA